MTPGEIHGLHKQVVDDLKAQLAAAREDASNERTRAEAAEQELRRPCNTCNETGKIDQRLGGDFGSEVVKCPDCLGEGHYPTPEDYRTMLALAMAARAKLAAIRAHLKGVDLAALIVFAEWLRTQGDAGSEEIDHLLAAAREALEP